MLIKLKHNHLVNVCERSKEDYKCTNEPMPNHLENLRSELRNVVKLLQKRVHVARCPKVPQSHESAGLFELRWLVHVKRAQLTR
jgi:hypothetical protein